MHLEAIFILLFIVATSVAIAARRWKIPYTVALVLAGLLLGAVDLFEVPHLTRELLFAVFLPGLLFEAAFHLPFRDFWRDRVPIVSLAVPGVVGAIALTTAVLLPVAEALDFIQGFTWRDALIFAALIAATDPIAVVALFKSLGAPRRLGLLMEGESLLNDGTAVVIFTLVLGLLAGQAVSAGGLALGFVSTIGFGVLIGAVVGLAVSQVIQRIDDPMIEITLTTISAYGSFVLAEQLHYSGVIATVTAGMLAGNYAARTGMSPSTRVAVESFWEYIAFALNSIIFLLIGFEVELAVIAGSWEAIVAAYLATLVGRAAVILAVSALLRSRPDRIPLSWGVVLTWGGLRGGISMVLALSLPAEFPHRSLIVAMTFGVVVLSILVNGLTMGPLLQRLGVTAAHAARGAYEAARGLVLVARAALDELERMQERHYAAPEVLDRLRREYEERYAQARTTLESIRIERDELREEETIGARRHLLLVEKEQAIGALREGVLGAESHEHLMADIDARLVELERLD